MAKNEGGSSFKKVLENGLGYVSSIISEKLYPRREEKTENFMKNVDGVVAVIERRVLGKISAFLVIGAGLVFLIFALHTYLKEALGWSSLLTNLILGTIILVIGLLMKLREYGRLEDGK